MSQHSLSRNAREGLEDLMQLLEDIEASSQLENESVKLYRKVLEGSNVSGRKMRDIVGACVIIASRKVGEPLDVARLVDSSESSQRDLFREEKRIKRRLSLSVEPVSIESYIRDYSDSLDVCEFAEEKATEFVEESQENGFNISGKTPRGIAASALYLACLVGDETKMVTQSKVASIAGVTEVTVRNHYQNLAECAGVAEDAREAVKVRS